MATVYCVKSIAVTKEDDDQPVIHVRWASSEGAAKKARRELAEELGLKPLKEVDYELVEIPTSKAGIIEWLNINFTKETPDA